MVDDTQKEQMHGSACRCLINRGGGLIQSLAPHPYSSPYTAYPTHEPSACCTFVDQSEWGWVCRIFYHQVIQQSHPPRLQWFNLTELVACML